MILALFLFLVGFDLFALDFSDYNVEFKKSKKGTALEKEFSEYFKIKKTLERDLTGAEITYFGGRVKHIHMRGKHLANLFVEGNLKMGQLKISGDVKVSFRNLKHVTFGAHVEGNRYFFNNIELIGKNGIFFKDGIYPPSAFSAIRQKSGNFEIYQNQPLFFKSSGELIPIDHIRYRGKDYFFKDMQRDGILPIDTHFASYNDSGAIARLYFEGNVEHLGNKCWGCVYVLCLEKDHFYVYEISEIHTDNKLVIHGRPVKDKGLDYGAMYYTDGDSQVAYVWRTDTGSSLYKERCSHVKDGYWSELSVPRRFEEYH